MRCRECGHEMQVGEYPFCPHQPVIRTPSAQDLRGFNARIWTGEQVYGRKYLDSEKGKEDTIEALTGGRRYGLLKG